MILDSYAGSGTTAHATLALNAEDGGNRRFILVQLPHDSADDEQRGTNIAREITATRVREVAHGYKPPGSKDKVAGLGGSFTYARVGKPLLGEHRDWGEKPPAYLDLARYVFYTETSRELDDKALNEKTGFIGAHGGASYYLLYTPDPNASRALDRDFLDVLRKDKAKRKVVYCEKVWVYRDDLRALRDEVGDVRPMILPLQVK